MPIFEYECAQGHRTDRRVSVGARIPGRVVCEACGRRARRVVSSFIHVWADGAHIDNDMARDQREFLRSEEGRKLLREDKLVPVSELRPEYCELTQKRAARDKEFEQDLSDLSAMKQAGMTPEQARERFRADKKAARTGAAKSKVVAA